jgi:acyl-CoA synthetase (AMP-forming)/AMP-acid ligase II
MATTAAALVAISATGMYVDARFGLARDYNFLRGYLGVSKMLVKKSDDGKAALVECFIEQAQTIPDKTWLYYKTKTWTWREADEETNRLVNWALSSEGLGLTNTKDLMVALLCGNAPEFLFSIIALWKVGCSIAFLNTMLTGRALQHTFDISKAKTVIVEDLLVDNLSGIWQALKEKGVRVAIYQSAFGHERRSLSDYQSMFPGLDMVLLSTDILRKYPSTEPPLAAHIRKQVLLGDLAALINTSGTTGLPKAAIINHSRLHSVPNLLHNMGLVKQSDRYYQCLPLFHSSGMIGLIESWISGCGFVLARKFSARSWWRDCADHGVTVAQYIGELIRYLVASPTDLPHEKYGIEGGHRVRSVFGNGMRPEIWEKFRNRFGVKNVLEFYAASEGMPILSLKILSIILIFQGTPFC